jgi:S-adenosylmethionine-dependent methyltransferase
MIDDVSDIAAFYDNNLESEHARLERHPLEYELTWRYLEQYLPAQGSILEIGAATGRYTLELARRGYQVTAVDLSAVESGRCRERIAQAGLQKQVELVVADVRNLAGVTGRGYDAVLLMGPLYHLIELSDRRMALQQAFERLRPGGLIFSAFISRFGILCDLMKDHPGWIQDQDEVRSILERGRDPHDFPHGGFRGYFALASEIAPLHEALGCESLVLAGMEPVIAAQDESYNKLEGQERQLWLDLLYDVSTEASIIGASRHLLYIGKKK